MSRPADAAPRSHGPRARGPERTLPDGRHRSPRPRLVARGDRPVWVLRLYMSNHTRLETTIKSVTKSGTNARCRGGGRATETHLYYTVPGYIPVHEPRAPLLERRS